MTIRSGGRPRDGRAQPVHPYDPDAYATDTIPEFSEPAPPRNGNGGGHGGGHGIIGLLKFLVFALILGGVVLAVGLTALRPVVASTVMTVAEDNPAALSLPFVEEIVRENLGAALTEPVSTESTQVEFLVESGDTARTIGSRLEDQGLIADGRAFVFISTVDGLTGSLQQGTFVLRKNMTPDQLVKALLAPPKVKYVDIALRTGLRLEQITAKLQTLPLDMDTRAFYELVKEPPAALIADYPWLATILKDAPKGTSLEGFLSPATYRVLPDTQPEELVRLMLDKFVAQVGEERLKVPADRGMTFYQVLTLASIVEREAMRDEERPIIAGVYQNRIDGYKGVAPVLNADPTVFFAIDTMELDKLKFDDWQRYAFWTPPGVPLGGVEVPPELEGYQTYKVAGLVPGPICTPSLPSIDAALEPDKSAGYLYFVAIPDGNGTHAFAKSAK
ncbi:MAG TPA: endolytic transglycosylase MltG, partial [Candidatus Limnocylindrales bacterium]